MPTQNQKEVFKNNIRYVSDHPKERYVLDHPKGGESKRETFGSSEYFYLI